MRIRVSNAIRAVKDQLVYPIFKRRVRVGDLIKTKHHLFYQRKIILGKSCFTLGDVTTAIIVNSHPLPGQYSILLNKHFHFIYVMLHDYGLFLFLFLSSAFEK